MNMTHQIAILSIVAAIATPTFASTILPFDVSVGGQKAVLKAPTAIFATVDTPVSANAPIIIHEKSAMIIINAFACDAKGNPKDGVQPAILMFQGKSSGTLADTLDKKPLPAGTYVANIVSNSRTSRIFFTVR